MLVDPIEDFLRLSGDCASPMPRIRIPWVQEAQKTLGLRLGDHLCRTEQCQGGTATNMASCGAEILLNCKAWAAPPQLKGMESWRGHRGLSMCQCAESQPLMWTDDGCKQG